MVRKSQASNDGYDKTIPPSFRNPVMHELLATIVGTIKTLLNVIDTELWDFEMN